MTDHLTDHERAERYRAWLRAAGAWLQDIAEERAAEREDESGPVEIPAPVAVELLTFTRELYRQLGIELRAPSDWETDPTTMTRCRRCGLPTQSHPPAVLADHENR
jgi:hypothetical protein